MVITMLVAMVVITMGTMRAMMVITTLTLTLTMRAEGGGEESAAAGASCW